MQYPEDLKYSKSHEWVREKGQGLYEAGLSDYAQAALGDVVFVNLPKPGDSLTVGSVFADVESVKAVSDIYSPLDGKVSAVNEALLSGPELINKAPYQAWLVQVENGTPSAELLSAAEYQAYLAAL
ncbi:MAG: glycine cleavage system protein GcvH [Treponema sp.]|jgi:glycine cleavage system H protein|nr:glycine cleavage system protein GcvH [Treponema sp.]